jgi:hypothetical protein
MQTTLYLDSIEGLHYIQNVMERVLTQDYI